MESAVEPHGAIRLNTHTGPTQPFLVQCVLHNWCNEVMVFAILSGMVHMKDPLLLIGKSSP